MYRGGNMVSILVEELILSTLRRAEDSLTIEDVARRAGIHRITASKYLAVLEAKGYIKYRSVGKAKLFSLIEGRI
jgi:DNA-binding IclR family transcriptional regulator